MRNHFMVVDVNIQR